jgi:hypothetical protein
VRSTSILLIDFIDREVLSINIRLEFRFKGSTDTAEAVPGDAAEERVLLDFVGAADAAEAVFGVAYKAVGALLVAATDEEIRRWRKRGTYRRTKSSASAPSCWSGGKCKLRGQSTILRYVSCGSSAQKGGQPMRHSNMMVPTDHQSQL